MSERSGIRRREFWWCVSGRYWLSAADQESGIDLIAAIV